MKQLVNTPDNKQEKTYTAPAMYMKQVPMCCSCETINGVSGVGMSSKNQLLMVYKNAPGTKLSTFDKFAQCITQNILTREGIFASAAVMLAHRILNCENPYETNKILKHICTQSLSGRIDGYHWPSKMWTMYDRLDIEKPNISTQAFGYWMEENAKELGIKLTTVDGPSVHAFKSGYSCFGSDKPHGYGIMRAWIMVVEDVEKLEKWYNSTIKSILDSVVYTDTKPKGVQLW